MGEDRDCQCTRTREAKEEADAVSHHASAACEGEGGGKLFDADRGIDLAREIRVASESVSPSGENLKGLMLPRAIRAGLRGAICGVLGTSGPWLISVV